MKRNLLLMALVTFLNLFVYSQSNFQKEKDQHGSTIVVKLIEPGLSRAIGDDCITPIVVSIPAEAPYTDAGQTTCGRNNNYDATCLGDYVGGEDIIYRIDVTADGTLDITMDPKGTSFTGLLIADDCPDVGTRLDFNTGSSGVRTLDDVAVSAGNSYYIMVDTWPTPNCLPDFDLTIDYTAPPPSCPDPTDQVETNVTSSSADLGWTENGSATQWEIMIDIAGFDTASYPHTITTSNPYSATGLSGFTSYDWYVRASCGGGDYSAWIGPSTFTTLCNTKVAPYTENFENGGVIPDCWSQGASNAENWKFSNNGTGNHLGIYGTMGGATSSGGYFAWVDDSSPHSTGTTLESPMIDVSGLTTPDLSFFLISNNEGFTNVDFSIDVWDGTTWNVGYYTHNTNTLNGEWEEIHVGLSALTIAGDMQFRFIIDENNGNDFYDDVAIDDVTVGEAPSCPAPSDLLETNITTSSADLGWTGNGSATQWEIMIDTAGFDTTSYPHTVTTSNSYSATGLSDKTSYDWYVRASCGGGDYSVWIGPKTFTTLQIPAPVQSLPFTEDWETNSIGAAWNYDAGLVSTIQTSTASAHGGTYGLEQYGNSKGYSFPYGMADAYSKAQPGAVNENWTTWNKFSVDLTTASNPWLSFKYAMGFKYYDSYNNFWVQVSTDDTTWTDLFSTQTNGATIAYTYKEFDLSSYNGTAQLYIRFFHNGKYHYNYLYIDDISVAEVSCLTPTAQTETNVTSSSADLGWTENGSATQWEIMIDIAGFDTTNYPHTITTSNPYSATGLSGFTSYDWYVRASCGGGDYSVWIGPSTFTTLQTPAPVQSLPFTEDWETNSISTAWNYDAGLVSTIQTSTASAHGGTYGLEQYGNSTGYSPPSGLADAYSKAQPGAVNENWTTWNKFSVDLTTASNPWLSFWYAMGYGIDNNYNNFWVQVSTDDTTWTDLYSAQTNDADLDYEKKKFDLSSYNGTAQLYIRFFHNGKYDDNYLYIDDISVVEVSCTDPTAQTETNITTSSADLGWTTGGASQWQIEWGAAGFTQGSGNLVGTTSNPYLLTGLSNSTNYDWYVRDICGAGDSSDWVGPGTFTTEVIPNAVSTFPYNESFETDFGQWKQMNADDFDWTRNTGGTPTYATGPSNAYNGSYYIYTESADPNFPNKTAGLLLSFDFTSLTVPQLTFAYHMYGATMGRLQFEASVDNGVTWDTIWKQTGDKGNQWNTATVFMNNYGGESNVYLKIWGITGSSLTSDMAVDSIDIREGPACPYPTQQTETNITGSSVDLGWITGGSSEWQIEWGTTGFTQGTGHFDTTTSNPYQLTGLNAYTDYDWYVRDICGAGDSSDWSGPSTFKTTIANQTNPTLCNLGLYIPDNGCSGANYATVPIEVTGAPGTQMGTDVILSEVKIIIEHPYVTELDIYLVSPGADTIELSTDNGGNGINYGDPAHCPDSATIFYMNATVNITAGTAPFIGYYVPEGDFADFNDGSDPNDVWKLLVCDDDGGYVGTVEFVELVFDVLSSCIKPTNQSEDEVTLHSVKMHWLSGESEWNVRIGETGFDTTSVAYYTVSNDTFLTVDTLLASTTYDWYVRSSCGGGDYSVWTNARSVTTETGIATGPYPADGALGVVVTSDTVAWNSVAGSSSYLLNIGTTSGGNDILADYSTTDTLYKKGSNWDYITQYFWTVNTVYNGTSDTVTGTEWDFTTACIATSLPYFQAFDDVTAPDFPMCMKVENTNADAYYWGTDSTTHHSAPNAAKIRYNPSLAMDDWFFTRGLNLSGGVTYEVNFMYKAGSTTWTEKLAVDWGNAAASASMSGTPIFNDDAIVSTAWAIGSGTFTPATSGVYYVGFHGYSDDDQYSLFIDDIQVVAQPSITATNYWTGNTDEDWQNGSNWQTGVPAVSTDVTIPSGKSNYPTVDKIVYCNNLTIESDATGDGSLIGVDNIMVDGIATVERYLTGGQWHDVSAMTVGATINSFYFDHNPDVWMNTYNESDNTRTGIIDLATLMPLGSGFEAWVETGFDTTATFVGPLNGSAATPTVTFSGPDPLGYNLVGNPFTSAIFWEWATIWGAPPAIDDQVWVYSAISGGYLDYVSGSGAGSLTGGVIPMGQGFFVHANNVNPTIVIPETAQIHSSVGFYKSKKAPPHFILESRKGKKHDEVWIVFHEGSTEAYENGFDGRKLIAISEVAAPQIYTKEGEEIFSVDALPPVDDNGRTIPLYFKVNQNGEQTIEAKDLELVPELKVILEDTRLNIMQDLNESPVYKFDAVTYQNPARFLLHLNRSSNGINDKADSDIGVYSFNKNIYVNSKGNAVNHSKQVAVFDLMGRKILNKTIPPGELIRIPVNVSDAYVVVRVISNGEAYTTKVFIK